MACLKQPNDTPSLCRSLQVVKVSLLTAKKSLFFHTGHLRADFAS